MAAPAPEDLIIAADGGYRHCQMLEILPDCLIGDLDSTPKKVIHTWENKGVKIIRHPEQKDETDLELALLFAQTRGARTIIVYGAAGGRLDMTLGNLLLLAHPKLTAQLTLICSSQEVRGLKPGETLELSGNPGDTVSLIALLPDTSGITTRGLEYALDGGSLELGITRGISNLMNSKQAQISLKNGFLAVIHTRNNL